MILTVLISLKVTKQRDLALGVTHRVKMAYLYSILPTISSSLSKISSLTNINLTSITSTLYPIDSSSVSQMANDFSTKYPSSTSSLQTTASSSMNKMHDSGLNDVTTHIIIVVLALLVIFALIGNFLLVAVIVSVRKLHSKTHIFIVDLAVSDIILAITVVPIDVDKLVKNGFHHNAITCEFVSTMFFMSLPASALSLSLLTLERYITLKYPLTRLKILTRERAVAALVLKWLYVIITASLPAMGWVYQPTTVQQYECNFFFKIEFAIFMVAANFVLPLLIILLANIEIFRIANTAALKMRQSTRRSEKRRASLIAVGANVKAAKRIMLLVGVFLMSWLPYIANIIVNMSCERCHSKLLSWIVLTLNYSNATMNPILYGLLNKEVRHEIKKLLREVSMKCTKSKFDKPFQQASRNACLHSVSMATEREVLNVRESLHETPF